MSHGESNKHGHTGYDYIGNIHIQNLQYEWNEI